MSNFYQNVPETDEAIDYLARLGLPEILTTRKAAVFLRRQPQTLHTWACRGTGPIKPHRIMGRVAWRTREVLALLIEPAQRRTEELPAILIGPAE
jgi:hypothetical protein